MVVVRATAIQAAVRRLDPSVRIILFYGSDETRIRALAASAVASIAGSVDEPFNVQRLDEGDVASDPGRLVDEVQSISLMGGRRVIWFGDADAHFLKSAERVLELRETGNLVVAEAGNLGKTSPLRSLLEASQAALVVPVYEPSVEEARAFVAEAFRERGISIDANVSIELVDAYGSDLGLLGQEVEKLDVYAGASRRVAMTDVQAICTSGVEVELSDIVDATLLGQIVQVEELLVRYGAGGGDMGQIAGACMRHVVQLQELQLAVERGQQLQMAVKSIRPAIFFRRSERVMAQLRMWPLDDLVQIAATLAMAVRDERAVQGLDGAIGMRALLSVARRAQGLAREKA